MLLDTLKIPNNTESEKALLGSLMIRKEYIFDVIDKLSEESFYDIRNAKIYSAIISLARDNKAVDLVTVTTELRNLGYLDMVGVDYVTELTVSVPYSANINYYLDSVVKNQKLREVMNIGYSLIEKGKEGNETTNIDSIISTHTNKLIEMNSTHKEVPDIEDSFDEFNKTQEEYKRKILNNDSGYIGKSSGFNKIDEVIDGIRPGHFWLIGGYCLGKGTNVVMSDFTKKKVEDVVVGDMLCPVDDDKPRRVVGTVVGKDKLYRVSGKYIEPFIVNSKHILPVYRDKKQRLMTAEQLFNSKSLHHFRLRKEGFKGEHKDLPIEPYFLGYWLGDGTTGKSEITCDEKEVTTINYVKEYAKRLGLRYTERRDKRNLNVLSIGIKTKNGGDPSTRKNSLTRILPESKYIPKEYFVSSREQRLELLAGLIDSDGYLGGTDKNNYVFCQKDIVLIKQVQELCESLGFNTSLRSQKQRESKLVKGCSGNILYRLTITGKVCNIPVKIPRKISTKTRHVDIESELNLITFKIEEFGYGDFYGFELDGNRLFMAQNYIVNHNTSAGKTQFMLNIINALVAKEKVSVFSLEMSKTDIISRLLGIETGFGSTKILRHEFDDQWQLDEFNLSKKRLLESGLRIYSSVNKLDDIIMAMTRDIIVHKTTIFAIDYAQLIRTKSSNEYEQISEVAQRLQNFARENNISIIILSQISNEHSKDQNRETMGFKGGGTLPASVDIAIELVNVNNREERAQRYQDGLPYEVNCIIRKNRHGRTGIIPFSFYPATGRFDQSLI